MFFRKKQAKDTTESEFERDWIEFLNWIGNPSVDYLKFLFKDPSRYSNQFLIRIMTVALSVDVTALPFYWRHRPDFQSKHYLKINERLPIENLSIPLLVEIVKIIEENVRTLGKQQISDENVYNGFNDYIRKLIGHEFLPEEWKRRAFDQYHAFSDKRWAEFELFITDKNIPVSWKLELEDLAQIEIQDRHSSANIDDEKLKDLDSALGRYMCSLWNTSEGFAEYSTELFKKQLLFIVEFVNEHGLYKTAHEAMEYWSLVIAFQILEGDDYKEQRRTLAELYILPLHKCKYESDYESAQLILEQFEDDAELNKAAWKMIETYEASTNYRLKSIQLENFLLPFQKKE